MVLFASHGYTTQTGTHAVSLAVVIYALLLGGLHRKLTATQYRVLKEGLFLRYHKSTIRDKLTYIYLKRNRLNGKSIVRSLLTGIPNLQPPLHQKGSKISHFCIKKVVSSAYSRAYYNVAYITLQLGITKQDACCIFSAL